MRATLGRFVEYFVATHQGPVAVLGLVCEVRPDGRADLKVYDARRASEYWAHGIPYNSDGAPGTWRQICDSSESASGSGGSSLGGNG